MTGRLEQGFRQRFRVLLALVRPGQEDRGVELLMRRGRASSRRQGLPLARALARVYESTRARVARRPELAGAALTPPWARFGAAAPPRFLCDPSLGGLARWLRAAGYEALLKPELAVDRLPDEALRQGLVLLTSESEVFERRIVRDGSLLALWVPSALTMHEQLRLVLRDLGLGLGAPRCMACGGELVATPKHVVEPRIPPRTARWKDEYFLCTGCNQLFWQGTHWERIARALAAAVGAE